MSRQLLDEAFIHSSISAQMDGEYQETIDEVKKSAANFPLLVVGMAQNPYCKKVRKNLDRESINYSYLEYGSYLKEWQRRLALKMWSGWPTFPMVFVNGLLVGGNREVDVLLASGELKRMLDYANE